MNLSARLSTRSFYSLTLFQSEKCTWLFSNDFRGEKAEATQWPSNKNSAYSAEDAGHMGSILASGRFLEKGKSILGWRIPWTEEPVGLYPMGLQGVGHDWSDWACTQREFFQLLTHFTLEAEVEGMSIPPDEVGETDTSGCHHCGASQSSSLSLPPLRKGFFPPMNSYESMKIVLEPNLQILIALLEIQGLGRNHQWEWVITIFTSSQVIFFFKIPQSYRFSDTHNFA